MTALGLAATLPRLALASSARKAGSDGKAAEATMLLFDQVQVEATLSMRSLRTKGALALAEVTEQRRKTDAARERFRALIAPIAAKEIDGVNGLSHTGVSAANNLEQARRSIDDYSTSIDESFIAFSRIQRTLVVLSSALTRTSGNKEITQLAALISTYLEAKEAKGYVYTYPAGRLDGTKWSDAELADFIGIQNNAERALGTFTAIADKRTNAIQAGLVNKPEYRNADSLAATLVDTAKKRATNTVTSEDWVKSANAALSAVNGLDDQQFAEFTVKADNVAINLQNSAIIYGTLALIGFLSAAIAAFVVGRSLTRRLKQVTTDAHSIAVDRLPEVLESLRHPTPEALAGALPQVTSDKNDEIGRLASDFNTILRTSIETSLEHSQRQASTMTNLLVNLGRRNQSLIDRQLELIDQLESSEQNPDLLESLFKLDHMVTRQRRNAESLLILAGSKRSRSWSAAVPLSDVIRGAISEVADLNRVRFEVQPGNDLLLSGQYAVDLSHLLAELIENATLFSNPSTVVTVRVQRGPQHFRVWVIDSGVGMSEEELASANQIVTLPPMIDELATDRVGFQVVGRLAQRFGVRVRIQSNPSGGVAASVDLPTTLFDALNQDQPVVAEAESAVRAATREASAVAEFPGVPPVSGLPTAPTPTAPPPTSAALTSAALTSTEPTARPIDAEATPPVVTQPAPQPVRQSRTGAPAPVMKFNESIVPPTVRHAAAVSPSTTGDLPRRAGRPVETPPSVIPRLAPKPSPTEPSTLPRRDAPVALPRRETAPTGAVRSPLPESAPAVETTAAGLPRRGALNGTFGAAGNEVIRRLPESIQPVEGNDAERRARMMKSFTQGVDAGRDDDHSTNGDAS